MIILIATKTDQKQILSSLEMYLQETLYLEQMMFDDWFTTNVFQLIAQLSYWLHEEVTQPH